jgi:hypothetical protein
MIMRGYFNKNDGKRNYSKVWRLNENNIKENFFFFI